MDTQTIFYRLTTPRIEQNRLGIGIYEFRYLWDPPHVRYRGVMAHEVAMICPEAVQLHQSGFLQVNYQQLHEAVARREEAAEALLRERGLWLAQAKRRPNMFGCLEDRAENCSD
jgi:hypothetical protein